MSTPFLPADHSGATLPITAVTPDGLEAALGRLPAAAAAFVRASGFDAKLGSYCLVPGAAGVSGVLLGLGSAPLTSGDRMQAGKLASVLPQGDYHFEGDLSGDMLAALAFALQSYKFTAYRTTPDRNVQLHLGKTIDRHRLAREVSAITMVRDLVNTPANDMGPAEIAAAAAGIAERHGATFAEVMGDELIRNFPLIHAVGHGSDRAPRLIDINWGDPAAPRLTLVGKGVAFDTGGYNIKPDSSMFLMKKDMGGAAHVLGLAHLIMESGVRCRLRVLIPAVENMISGRAFRPSDVFRSRKGLTVEIGNTDAEGRLILADALALADEDSPDLLIDMATLTGAARVALGPELPPFYSEDDTLAADLQKTAMDLADPLWRMPLWPGYQSMLDSKVADMTNAPTGGFAGSVTAALFLKRFVEKAKSWVHIDIFAWNPTARPGRPEGGEAQAIRALHDVILRRYGA